MWQQTRQVEKVELVLLLQQKQDVRVLEMEFPVKIER